LTLKSRAADVISGKILKELDAEARQLLLLLAHSSRLRMSYLVMYAAKENVMLCAVYTLYYVRTHTHIYKRLRKYETFSLSTPVVFLSAARA
jgi:hypothetical protein